MLGCLAAIILCRSARCVADPNRSLPAVNVLHTRQHPSQALEQHRRRQNLPAPFDVSQVDQVASTHSRTDVPHPESTDGSMTLGNDFPSSIIDIRPTTGKQPHTTTDLTSSTPTSRARSTTSSIARPDITSAASATLTISSTTILSVMPTATVTAISSANAKPFRMSAASIAATVVLGCFVCGGTAIMVYFRVRRSQARGRRNREGGPSLDNDCVGRPKSLGASLVSSKASLREDMMYHPNYRELGVDGPINGGQLNQNVAEWKPPYRYCDEHTEIPMRAVELTYGVEGSPVSPLVSPAFPRPVGSITHMNSGHNLRRKFSFEDIQGTPHISPNESRLHNSGALTSNPPSEWPLTVPFYHSIGLPSRPHERYQPAPTDDRRSNDSRFVAQRESFEDVETWGG